MPAHYCFLDTSVLIEFEVARVPWKKLLKSSDVVLTIAPVVWRELEDLKTGTRDNKKVRARDVVAWLAGLRKDHGPSPVITKGTTLHFLTADPPSRWFAGRRKLRSHIDDDHLLATILEFRRSNRGVLVSLATDDGGLLIKAEALGVPVLLPPEETRRNDLDPMAQELRDLRAEVAALRGKLPRLRFGFRVGGQNLEVTRYLPKLNPSDVAGNSKVITELLSARPDIHEAGVHQLLGEAQHGDVGLRQRNRVVHFLGVYEKYLKGLAEWERNLGRTIRLEFRIENEGTAAAEDVEVALEFRGAGTAYEYETLPERLGFEQLPELPFPTEAFPDVAKRIAKYEPVLRTVSSWKGGIPHDLIPEVKAKANSYVSGGVRIRYQLRIVKQNQSHSFNPLYLRFKEPEDVRNFSIAGKIVVVRPPIETSVTLNVRVLEPSPDAERGS